MRKEQIEIRLSFTGVIDIKNAKPNTHIKIANGSSIGDLLSALSITKEHKRFIISIVNNEKQRQTYILKDGDHLSLFLPVGGG